MNGFPITAASPVVHDGPLPDAVDVTVIGGGVIGVCTALFLARKGQRVLLLEKGRIAGEQSSRNWGWIRQQGRDPAELPIMVEANALWRQLAREANADFGLVPGGVTYLARDQRKMQSYAGWLPHATAHGVDSVLLDRDALRNRFPELAAGGYVGALTTPSDMRAEPWVAVPALAGIAAREGAVLRENCAARGLDMHAGRVNTVITERGRVTCPEVVLAGGAWCALFLRRHGVHLPQLSVRSNVAATEPVALPHAGAATDGRIAFRPRADGGVSLAPGGFHELFIGRDAFAAARAFGAQLRADPFGTRFRPAAPKGYPDAWFTPRRWSDHEASPFEQMRILDPRPSRKRLQRAADRLSALFPDAGAIRLRTVWAGMIDVMPDIVPVVDRCAVLPGLTIGTGMSGHGFGIGPAMGRLLADLATGAAPGHDLSRFRLSRFSDGSPMQLGPAL